MICKREETVSALWERVKKHHVIHICATPASGKSVLSDLLQNHVMRECPDLLVMWRNWPVEFPEGTVHNDTNCDLLLNRLFDVPPKNVRWLDRRVLLIIDEAQFSYAFSSLWNDFIKNMVPRWLHFFRVGGRRLGERKR